MVFLQVQNFGGGDGTKCLSTEWRQDLSPADLRVVGRSRSEVSRQLVSIITRPAMP